MGMKAGPDMINFNYPIPRTLHKKVRELNLRMGMPVKDIVINALMMYIDSMNRLLDEEMAERALNEPHGTDPFGEDDL